MVELIQIPVFLGLFQRAIIMSPREIWKLVDEEKNSDANKVEKACRDIALSLGCNSKENSEILHCMRTRSLSDILSVYPVGDISIFDNPVYHIRCIVKKISSLRSFVFLYRTPIGLN